MQRHSGPVARRDFRRFFLGQTLTALGDGAAPIGVIFAVIQMGGGAAAIGLVLAVGSAALVLTLPLGGLVADRVDRVKILAVSDLARAIVQVLLGTCLFLGSGNLELILGCAIAYSVFEGLYRPAQTGALPDLVPSPELQGANGLLSVSQSTAFLLGPAIGGVVVTAGGPATAILLDSATFAVSAALMGSIVRARGPRPQTSSAASLTRHDLMLGFRTVRQRGWLWQVIALFSIYLMLCYGPQAVLGPLVADASYDGAAGWSVIMSGFAAGSLAGGVAALRFRSSRPIMAGCWSLLLAVPAPFLLAWSSPLWMVTGGQVLMGMSFAFFAVLWNTALQTDLPTHLLSRVSAIDWMGSQALFPIGLLLAGPAAAHWGTQAVLLSGAFIGLVIILALIVSPTIRSHRSIESAAMDTSPRIHPPDQML